MRRLTRFFAGVVCVSATWLGCDGDMSGPPGTGGEDGGAAGMGGSPKGCAEDCAMVDAGPCAQSVCDEATGSCTLVAEADGGACDDGLFCTTGDVCSAGECIGTGQNQCGVSVDPWSCTKVVCDEESDSCNEAAVAEDSPCTAEDPCEIHATCQSGVCQGFPNTCADAPLPNVCHTAQCNPVSGLCEATPANDGLTCAASLCELGGTCTSGACVGAAPRDCSHVGDACNAASCDANTGGCVTSPINESGACSDEVGCTVGDSCNSGACVPGAVVSSCVHDDGCCGPGCSSTNDNDCQSILLFGDGLSASDWERYRNALIAAGRTWDESDFDSPGPNQGAFPDAGVLANYETVIIAADGHTGWPDADNLALTTWLQEAGERNLLLIGKDILYDFYLHAESCAHDPCDVGAALQDGCASYVSSVCHSIFGDPTCCSDAWTAACAASFATLTPSGCPNGEWELFELMGVAFAGSSTGFSIDEVVGVQLDPITDAFFSTPIRVSGFGVGTGDYAAPGGSAATDVAFYAGPSGDGVGQTAMTRYTNGYQLVWVGFNMHDGIDVAEQRNELMRAILEWFKG